MLRNYFLLFSLTLGAHFMNAQEIIPFPDLTEQYQLHRNGGKSVDDRNYAIFTEDYQEALAELDAEADALRGFRKDERSQEKIDLYNDRLETLEKKKSALLSEAQLAEDLQKFY